MGARQSTLLEYKRLEELQKAREAYKKYYAIDANRKRHNARCREIYRLNRDAELARTKLWARNNPERTKESSHIRYLRRRNKMNQKEKLLRALIRKTLFSLLGEKCVLCGYNLDSRALQFDHINGGGYKDGKKWGNHTLMLKHYSLNPKEAKQTLQTLCANCNTIKLYKTSSH